MKRILVVDDDDNLREVLSAVLSQRGRAVDTARDGIEALALLNQNQYDVILSDLRMPGLDGPALYEALRAMRHTTTMPRVIFMTGNVRGGEYAAFLQGTTEPMLEKPFNLDVVRQVVRVLLKEQ
jgi:CheY-like chemotaxis protein